MITRLFGITLLFGCLAIVYLFEETAWTSGAFRLLHWPAILLTGVGPLALVILCSDWQMLLRTLKLAWGRSPSWRQSRHEREAVFLRQLGNKFYADGVKAFEEAREKWLSHYVAKVLGRMTVRMPLQDIRALLQTERERMHNRFCQSLNVACMGVRLAPSVGMLGTILGMVQLLTSLQDASQIGPRMSLALLTTFYGLFFSLAVWTPVQQKIERISEVELDGYDQVIRWLEFLEKRKPEDYFADTVDLPLKSHPTAARAKSGGKRSAA